MVVYNCNHRPKGCLNTALQCCKQRNYMIYMLNETFGHALKLSKWGTTVRCRNAVVRDYDYNDNCISKVIVHHQVITGFLIEANLRTGPVLGYNPFGCYTISSHGYMVVVLNGQITNLEQHWLRNLGSLTPNITSKSVPWEMPVP